MKNPLVNIEELYEPSVEEKCYDITFVVLTWNSGRYIYRCLNSIKEISNLRVFTIIIDNGSEDDSVELIKDFIDRDDNSATALYCLDKNYGTTVSRNIGISFCLDNINSKYICILDSDTEINEQAIQYCIRSLMKNKRNGIVGPKLVNEAGVPQDSAKKVSTLSIKFLKMLPINALQKKGELMEKYCFGKGEFPVAYLMSAFWLVKTEVFRQIGLLDESIYYAPEDLEFCLRAWKNGYRVLYCNREEVVHTWQRLSKKKLLSKHNFEQVKGMFYIFKKYKYIFTSSKIDKLIS